MIRATFILPASQRAAANQAALQFDPIGGDKSFGPPCLSATGNAPATHCWASGQVSEDILPQLQQMAPAFECELFVDIDPFEALATTGLKLVQEPMP